MSDGEPRSFVARLAAFVTAWWFDLALAAGLGAIACLIYFASVADYAYPGTSAHLMALWTGLDAATVSEFPVMAFFAKMFGVSNMLAPVLGGLAVALVYAAQAKFLKNRLAGVVAAVVFMLTPAVREAATHLEPRLFDFVWAASAVMLASQFARANAPLAYLAVFASAVMAGMGLADSPLCFALLPVFFFVLLRAAQAPGRRPWGALALFVLAGTITFFWTALGVSDEFGPFGRSLCDAFAGYVTTDGWLFVMLFATLPCAIAAFAAPRALNRETSGGLVQWLFHGALTLVSILSVATPLSPSAQMEPFAILPVAASAFAALLAGYLVAYWLEQVRAPAVRLAADGATPVPSRARYVGSAVGGVFAFVLVFSSILHLFDFDARRGAFADRLAERVIRELGTRTWLVTDGVLDDHLRLAAAREKVDLHLVCLQRDLDEDYLKRLGADVKAAQLGGDKNADLVLSLSLGVLPFVQDWLGGETDVAAQAAVWGASDLWYTAGKKPVPELFFFGADETRTPDWAGVWPEIDTLLAAPKDGDRVWGSYRLSKVKNPVERMRLNLRRHMGLIANNRGVWLQDAGCNDDAFAMYELVLNEIDADNICALFNEFELARTGETLAAKKRKNLEDRLKSIVDDADRRYRLWAIGNYYGYIRSPEIFVRLGFSWARSGRPGEAIRNIRRAIDFVPTERRSSLMNMLASIYASESEHGKSRAMYESVLEADAENHDALVGMMRLALVEGDADAAAAYLERATAAAGDDPRGLLELAMLKMMRNELEPAKDVLRRVTDADASNLQAWSLLAAVTIQQIDAAKDEASRKALMKDLEGNILATMEKQARDPADYYVQTTRAFLLLRKGADRRKEARDAFIAAARDRPDIAATGDIILGLDISLNDTVDAERHAREVLRRNRRAPLANYVMGSLALQKGEYAEAEAFLRRSVDTPRPIALALNDLAEVLRRAGHLDEAESFARDAVRAEPKLYVAWDTLATLILARHGDLNEAEECVNKALELSRDENGREIDVRMLVSLARIQLAKGDRPRGKSTLRKVQSRIDELSAFERKEFEELQKGAR